MIEIEVASPFDAKAIAQDMRAHDRFEFDLAKTDPEAAIVASINRSQAWTVFVDGRIACVWGVRQESLLGGAHIWLVTSPLVNKHRIAFLRKTRAAVQDAVAVFGHLYGYVDADYRVSCRWMEWLGFELTSMSTVNGVQLCRYEMHHGN